MQNDFFKLEYFRNFEQVYLLLIQRIQSHSYGLDVKGHRLIDTWCNTCNIAQFR